MPRLIDAIMDRWHRRETGKEVQDKPEVTPESVKREMGERIAEQAARILRLDAEVNPTRRRMAPRKR